MSAGGGERPLVRLRFSPFGSGAHPGLGPRLDLCTGIVLASESPSLHAIFGSPDDLKFRSCMTLFSLAADDPDNPFHQALDRCAAGSPTNKRWR